MKAIYLLSILIIVFLFSCKKDSVKIDNDDKESTDTVPHVAGLSVDTSLITGNYKWLGTGVSIFWDTPPVGTTTTNYSYENRYKEFNSNGLLIIYSIDSNGNRINMDTLVYASSYVNEYNGYAFIQYKYTLSMDSMGSRIYNLGASREYYFSNNGPYRLMEYDPGNYTEVDTLLRVF